MNINKLDSFIEQFEIDKALFHENPNDAEIRQNCDQTRQNLKWQLNLTGENQWGTGRKIWEFIKDLTSSENDLHCLYGEGLHLMKWWAKELE